MQFQAKSEKQIAEENLLPEGVYPFEVIGAADKQSKAGNDMIELRLRVFNGERSHQLTDWIMEKLPSKLFHFCAYSGLSRQYEAGTLSGPDCIGKNGYVSVIIQEDKTGQYPPRNSVKDYVRQPEMKKSGVVADTDVPY